MAHYFQGILGPDTLVARIARDWLREPVGLDQGIGLLPLTEDLRESIDELAANGNSQPYEELSYLSSSLRDLLARYSIRSWVAYIETEYFGGTGSQSSALWKDTELVFGPCLSSSTWDSDNQNYFVSNGWPINEALRNAGVWTDGSRDEFDMLGLGDYRSIDDFDAA